MNKKILSAGLLSVIAGGSLLLAAGGHQIAELSVTLSAGESTVMAAAEKRSAMRVMKPGEPIGTVEAQEYATSGLDLPHFDYAQYVAEISDGTYLGFNISSGHAIVKAISSTDTDVVIPDTIKVGDNEYGVREFRIEYENSIPGLTSNIKSITFPASITYCCLHNNYAGGLTDIYMLGGPINLSNMPGNIYYRVCDRNQYASFKEEWNGNRYLAVPYGWDFEWITVDVAKTGEFAETYLKANDNDWSKGVYVKVTGKLSTLDLEKIRNLTNLEKIDLSGAVFEEVIGDFLRDRPWLREVKLPDSAKNIGNAAFHYDVRLEVVDLGGVTNLVGNTFGYCRSLRDINIGKIVSVGNEAFRECLSLKDLDFSSVEFIGSRAFRECRNLRSFVGMKIKEMSYDAFFGCTSLEKIEIGEGLTKIPSSAFRSCSNLKEISFPSVLTVVESQAFEGCRSIEAISLPEGFTELQYGVFSGCSNLQTVTLPSTLRSVGEGAFEKTSLKEVVCRAVVPPIAQRAFVQDTDLSKSVLKIPPFSKDFYRNTRFWNDFFIMESLREPVKNIYVDRELTINLEEEDNELVADKPHITLAHDWSSIGQIKGQLTVEGNGTLSAGAMDIHVFFKREGFDEYIAPTMVNNADRMRADEVNVTMKFNYKNQWYFISLPYDVKVSDIKTTDDTYFSIQSYDGNARANSEPAWKKLGGNDVMKGGRGYIISVTSSGNEPQVTFPSGNSTSKNSIFKRTDATVALEEYLSEFDHNRSWNLVGNPYPSYFDFRHINGFSSPVTVWDGYNYRAFSPLDDDYCLSPYEAFFVQCPVGTKGIVFKEEGRQHSNEVSRPSESPSRIMLTAEERNIFNFNVKVGNVVDRARIVLNPEAKTTYELERDASKFFSESDIQIYVVGNGGFYAIDERPLADGFARLGLRASKDGVATISLDGKFANGWSVILTDNSTGKCVDLTRDEYSFNVSTGDDNDRFMVAFKSYESGVDSIFDGFEADDKVIVTTLDGLTVFKGAYESFDAPADGIYIVSGGDKSIKIHVKR